MCSLTKITTRTTRCWNWTRYSISTVTPKEPPTFRYRKPVYTSVARLCTQGLKWGRVARVRDPAPFDLPGLYRVSCLLSCSSKSHKIPLRMHQNSPFSDKKISAEGNSTSDCGRDPASFLDHFEHCIYLGADFGFEVAYPGKFRMDCKSIPIEKNHSSCVKVYT